MRVAKIGGTVIGFALLPYRSLSKYLVNDWRHNQYGAMMLDTRFQHLDLLMPEEAQSDTLVMSLIDQALALPLRDREAYLRMVCADNSKLFGEVWSYVQWERRMDGFLLDPLVSTESPRLPFQPGELLDARFRIVRDVAEGGMGVVYEALDEKLGRRIAIKCGKPAFCRRLPAEVLNATEISHPNVCKIFEIHTVSTSQGEIDFFTMEFLEGETLAKRLDRELIPEAESCMIARQLCAGLAEAHRNHVIHGDLKSNNIILSTQADGSVRAVITDFGLARRSDISQSSTQSEAMGGTPGYMAPELWRGEQATVASDVYALGVILYELAGGRRPHEMEVSWPVRYSRKALPVHPNWHRMLSRCLDPDPTHRFRSANEVLEALAPRRSRRAFLIAAAAVILAAGTDVLMYQTTTVPSKSGRLAVLPFVNAGGRPESEYLSNGLSEDLINRLTQMSALKVIARGSSFKFKGDRVNIQKAGRELGAEVLVTGRIAEKNGQVRISTELVNSTDGTQIWGAQYTCTISDLARTQSEMAREIAERISSRFTQTDRLKLAKAAKVNPEAYDLLLRARYQIGLYTPESKQRAITYFERALAIDPEFAQANAELAFAYRLLSSSGILSATDAIPKAEAAARKALAIDNQLAEAHAALAGIKRDQWDWAGAEQEYRRALQLNPNLELTGFALANYLSVTGRANEALTEIQRVIETDPIGVPAAIAAAAVDYNLRRYDHALVGLKRAVELDPSRPSPWTWIGIVNGGRGNYEEAIPAYEKAMVLGDHTAATRCYYAYALARSGRRGRAIQLLQEMKQTTEFVPLSTLAILYLGLNQKERALELLTAAYVSRDPLLQYINVESHFETLKTDERFRKLVQKIGLPQ